MRRFTFAAVLVAAVFPVESGVPDASMGVFTAARKVMKHQKRWLAARKSGSPRL